MKLTILVVLLASVSSILALPDGAPAASCINLTPTHGAAPHPLVPTPLTCLPLSSLTWLACISHQESHTQVRHYTITTPFKELVWCWRASSQLEDSQLQLLGWKLHEATLCLRVHKNGKAWVRVCDSENFETGRNLPPVLKIVTYCAAVCRHKPLLQVIVAKHVTGCSIFSTAR